MAKTVLEYVQSCLSVMDSDNVDTINDTVEAIQVANQLKENYFELLARQDWPFMKRAIMLTAAADTDSPTKFTIPENVKLVEWLKYNTSETGSYRPRDLCYLEPDCFLDRVAASESATNTTLVVLPSRVKFYVRTDSWPSVWTTFDDVEVHMDSVHNDYESTLTEDKLTGWGVAIPDFTIEDDFTPLIPLNMEPLLQSELNRDSFRYFKQTESAADERKAARQLARGRREASRVERPSDIYYRNRFGRK